MKKGQSEVHAETRSSRREPNHPPSAPSAPPRAKNSGWQIRTLGEILEKTETVNPLLSPNTEFDYIDVSSVSNTTFEIEETQRLKGKDAPSRARKLVRTNDIIFATIRPTLQRIAVVPEHLDKQVCSTGYFVLRPKQGIDHRFIFYSLFTESFSGEMESLQKGASYPAVTDGDVRAQKIPVPPLAEQQRIVGLLDEAFEDIATAKANAEKNLQNARALFENHLQSVFTQRGPGWVEKRLDEACVIIMGQSPDGETYNTVGEGMPLINGPVEFSPDSFGKTVRSKFTTKPTKLCKKNDLILCVRGSTTGRMNISGFDACIGRGVAAIRAREYQPWINHFINAKREEIYRLGTGATFPNISGAILGGLKLSVPALSAQKEIVSKLDALAAETQRLARLYEQKLAALGELKKSLLHQAFTGEL